MAYQPTAIVVGFIAKLPVAGMCLYCLHHIVGLIELGYRIHYVERQNYNVLARRPFLDSGDKALLLAGALARQLFRRADGKAS